MATHFFEWQNKKIAYNIAGEGRCILLLHGYTESKEIWVNISKTLAVNHCVICPDIPGHGESDLLDNNSIKEWADLMIALLTHLNYNSCVAIGHSMGGYILCNMAARFESVIEGLGLFHSSARADSTEVRENRMRIIDVIKSGKASFLNNFITSLFAKENQERLSEDINILKLRSEKISDQALIISQQVMAERQGQIEMLVNANFPFLFIIGKKDKRADLNSVIAQAIMVKKASVLILENCGHMGYLEAPGETFAAIVGFIELTKYRDT